MFLLLRYVWYFYFNCDTGSLYWELILRAYTGSLYREPILGVEAVKRDLAHIIKISRKEHQSPRVQ